MVATCRSTTIKKNKFLIGKYYIANYYQNAAFTVTELPSAA